LSAKNKAHDITGRSIVLLASSLSFDPCLSDILATFHATATLAIAPRSDIVSDLPTVLQRLKVTHILCTPTLWSLTSLHGQKGPFDNKNRFSHLERVALGGEPIPKRLLQMWARSHLEPGHDDDVTSLRLLATYGVTEACVYQTCGEVFLEKCLESKGQYVGFPLQGTNIRICKEDIQDHLIDVDAPGEAGEIILYGKQVDEWTSYLNRPELESKFVAVPFDSGRGVIHYYRTGDRGMLNPRDCSLTILGRIVGEEGMVKINGVRVELGEVESALVDNLEEESHNSALKSVAPSIIVDCLALVNREEASQSSIYAYCILSPMVCQELGISLETSRNAGFIINGDPLWTLLRARCKNLLKAACIPSAFVAISHFPLSPTGKRDRSKLPKLQSCHVISNDRQIAQPLKHYGRSGGIVSDTIVEVLNLQSCQQQLLTTSASFAMMGGDSLSATLIARTLYAHNLEVENSRFLGGEYGQLPEPFNVVNLIRAKCLGDYVDLLDRNNVCFPANRRWVEEVEQEVHNTAEARYSEEEELYDALLQAITLDQPIIAVGLLQAGADPNFGSHGGRIGKTSSRIQQRAIFKGNPLHLACTKGDSYLVQALLQYRANYKSPNTNGLFPIHLAAGTLLNNREDESRCRLECVKLLLEAGCPLLMRDANKQTILHAAARAGHTIIIEFCIKEYYSRFEQDSTRNNLSMPPSHFINCYDRWFRTAVHWAILNGRVEALRILLDRGCHPAPTQPKTNKYTSMANETPLEICRRMYRETEIGLEMERVLTEALDKHNNSK
jgi:ankyrin repeat protein